jgi:hypothetical protein
MWVPKMFTDAHKKAENYFGFDFSSDTAKMKMSLSVIYE